MRRTLAIVILLSAAVGVTSEGRQSTPAHGLVIEAIERWSAASMAGLQVGDTLVAWTRKAKGSTASIAQGEFLTPFDARAFEIEELPRGGTTVAAIRGDRRIEVSLVPGAWDVTVRPAMTNADLSAYSEGKALAKDRATETLGKWEPIIDRWTREGDVRNAGWLLTRAGAAFVEADQLPRADQIFERAAALFRMPADPLLEAMVWEAKANALHPEYPPINSPTNDLRLKKSHMAGAFASFERARTLRAEAAARSLPVVATDEGAALLLLRDRTSHVLFGTTTQTSNAEERSAWQVLGVRLKTALDILKVEAAGSYAHAHALAQWGSYVVFDFGPQASNTLTIAQAGAASLPLFRAALPLFEEVAPAHGQVARLIDRINELDIRSEHPDEKLLRREIALAAESGIQQPNFAGAVIALAQLLASRGAIDEAISVGEEGLRSSSPARPLSLNIAISLEHLYLRRGNVAAAEQMYRREVVKGREAGDPARLVSFLPALARVLQTQNTPEALDEAIALREEELHLRDTARLTGTAQNVVGLARMYSQRGDVGRAEQLALSRFGHATDADQGRLLSELAQLAFDRGELTVADSLAAQARSAWEKNQGDTEFVRADFSATIRDLQSRIALARGDAVAALALLDSAIGVSPSPENQYTLNRRVRAASLRGDSAALGDFTDQALALARDRFPGTVGEVTALHNAAITEQGRNHSDLALSDQRRAVELARLLEPGSARLAHELHSLAHDEEASGERAAALGHFEEAMALLESARLRRGDTGGSAWGGLVDPQDTSAAGDVVRLLVADGRLASAFNVVERSRGQALLHMLAVRSLRDADVPADLQDKRRSAESEYETLQARLATLSTVKDAATIATTHVRLRALQGELTELNARIASADSRAAALQHPKPLTLAEAREQLDPGTVLLSYLVGPAQTYLFVVTPAKTSAPGDAGVSVLTLPVGESALRTRIEAFRRLIDWDTDPAAANRAALLDRSRSLYDVLIRPAETSIAVADRILVSLDGPLQALPFAALAHDTPAGRPEYLIKWKPLHQVTSMSVYAEIRQSRHAFDAMGPLVAFGDPKYPAQSATPDDLEVQALVRRGMTLASLPGTRIEVGNIAKLFAPHATIYLGDAATESRATALDRSVRFVHFAVHGVIDDEQPLNSALVLTMPTAPGADGRNGLLQSWKIFEHVRVDADLVTLSACDTGLGKQINGEGVVGLTRAFLYAGAHTVASSLWKVADSPTADLMTQFYANLKAGLPKDLALQKAQLAYVAGGRRPGSSIDLSSPAYWAAFTLTGDWK